MAGSKNYTLTNACDPLQESTQLRHKLSERIIISKLFSLNIALNMHGSVSFCLLSVLETFYPKKDRQEKKSLCWTRTSSSIQHSSSQRSGSLHLFPGRPTLLLCRLLGLLLNYLIFYTTHYICVTLYNALKRI